MDCIFMIVFLFFFVFMFFIASPSHFSLLHFFPSSLLRAPKKRFSREKKSKIIQEFGLFFSVFALPFVSVVDRVCERFRVHVVREFSKNLKNNLVTRIKENETDSLNPDHGLQIAMNVTVKVGNVLCCGRSISAHKKNKVVICAVVRMSMFHGANGHFQFENIHKSVICAVMRMDIFSHLCSGADVMSSLFHIFHFSFLNEKRGVQMKISASRTSKIRSHTDLDRIPSKNESFG